MGPAHRTRAAAVLLAFAVIVGVLVALMIGLGLLLVGLALKRALG